ncbi:hypothetical protein M5362_02040 [Streptomyces sp. Je 1-79]|uniref:hypothetical protein n=1 Tax=Streptomyces sp. Je 1-79 TaxID=2943847 RepID=UPI0021A44C78|nr:hypothetical protein [Streptomyces sp. Je 1-79]MCT4351915.1 hypothetical protein [Streptomyces sp. Je 1-79]
MAFALRHMGPVAGRRVERLRRRHPEATAAELRALVATGGRRTVTSEGAFVGGPFILLIPVAFCGALLLQARTILELAGLDGRDTTAPERAAEILVLQGVYADTAAAEAGLRARPSPSDDTSPRRGRMAALWRLTLRMARLLGLVTPDGGGRGRLARTGQWVLVGAVFLVGLVAPLVWLPYMGVSYHRATGRLTDRAIVFYFGTRDAPPPRKGRIQPDMVLAGLRALVSILIPLGVVILVLFTDLELGGARWPLLALLLVASPLVVGGIWLWRHHAPRRFR